MRQRTTPLIPYPGEFTDEDRAIAQCKHPEHRYIGGPRCDAVERPGWWVEGVIDDWDRPRERSGDGRELDQEQTDLLIACELFDHCMPDEVDELKQMTLAPHALTIEADLGGVRLGAPIKRGRERWATNVADPVVYLATEQRGGVHSDPMVRVLAFRAWGRRDLDFDVEAWRMGARHTGLETRYFQLPLADGHRLSYDSYVELNDLGEAQLAASRARTIGVVHSLVASEDFVTVRAYSPSAPTDVRLVMVR